MTARRSQPQPPSRPGLLPLIVIFLMLAGLGGVVYLVIQTTQGVVVSVGAEPAGVLSASLPPVDGEAIVTANTPTAPAPTETTAPESASAETPVAKAATPPPPTPTAPPIPPTPGGGSLTFTGVVTGSVVNLRSGPGVNYDILAQVREGDQVTVQAGSEDGGWWQICCPVEEGKPAWLSADFVEERFDPASVTIAAAPATPTPGPTSVPAPVVVGSAQSQSGAAQVAAPAPGLPGPGGFGSPGEINPLTGLSLPGERRTQRPMIVCINNDFAARPQYGIAQADVMVEYLMEGFSITRFSGIFYGETADRIGPVRSARLINLYLGTLYDAGLICSGASDRVRYTLKYEAPFPYMDIDLDDPSNNVYSFSLGSDYRTRLQTSSEGFRRWLAGTGNEKAPALRGFTFGELPSGGAPGSLINIPYPGGSRITYRYDPGSGRYLRFMGDSPHMDGAGGGQLALDNVIVQYVPHEVTDIVEDSLGSKSIRLNLFGGGRAILFRNGLTFEGTWRSDSQGDMPRFFKNDGGEVPLKPGKSWISVVPFNYTIGYQ